MSKRRDHPAWVQTGGGNYGEAADGDVDATDALVTDAEDAFESVATRRSTLRAQP
jgi:hypothetical protein